MTRILLTHRTSIIITGIVLLSLLIASCETETFSDSENSDLATIETGVEVNRISNGNKGVNDSTFVTNLLAGQHHIAGTLSVTSNDEDLVVTFKTNTTCTDTTSSWVLNATHLYVGACENIPMTRKGNPKIGKFPYKEEHPGGISEFTYNIPLADLDECFCIAAHAEVDCGECDDTEEENENESEGEGKSNEGDNAYCGEETAWAEGIEFKGNSWAMYLEFCIDTDTEEEEEEEETEGES